MDDKELTKRLSELETRLFDLEEWARSLPPGIAYQRTEGHDRDEEEAERERT